ncbi:hypothetical protein [Gemmobacter caeruleus]|nr:hypothetical protein [Gemmobacter caeruleus]
MTDRVALALGAILIVLILLDLLANGGGVLVFLARKILDLSEYLIFWR